MAVAGGPYSGIVGAQFDFDGSGSSDPDGNNLTYRWDFGDGSAPGGGVSPSHLYNQAGTYTVTLTVSDGALESNASSTPVTVDAISVPTLNVLERRVTTASQTISGTAQPGQAIVVYLNGTLAATGSANSLGIFQDITVTLQDGPNNLVAKALSGNIESAPSNLVAVNLDTSMDAIDAISVTVDDLGNGQVRVSAPPGSAPAGAQIFITSQSGGSITVAAPVDGSFSASLNGNGASEPVSIRVEDAAGNSSPVTDIGAAVGALAGTFIVNETGAATYTVPIDIPPGVAGMQPELALSYSSQAGNGLLGVGWNLSGLSAITRCPKTYAQDSIFDGVSFDANDRFCMDGQRLVNIAGGYGANGTVYRTEVDDFSIITQNGASCGGPCGFTVQTKSGQTVVYGSSDNTRQNVSTTSAVLQWAINSITDATGNAIRFEYYKNTPGDHRIKQITYTYNQTQAPLRAVEFIYNGNRPDISSGYVAGELVTNTQRLQTVLTKIGTQKIKEYRLSYEIGSVSYASRINTITECVFDAAGAAACIPPTYFDWQEGQIGFEAASVAAVLNATKRTTTYKWQSDFNGDGKEEIVVAVGGDLTMYEYAGPDADVKLSFYPVANNWGGSDYTFAADFTGDGFADIASASGSNIFMKLGQSNSFTSETWTVIGSWGSGGYTWTGDFNGDGLADIASASGGNIYMKLSNGGGFTSQTWSAANLWGPADKTSVADFNGDGLSDIASISGSVVYMKLSTGTGFVSESWNVTSNWEDAKRIWVKDFNGDGLTDIATGKTTPLKVKLSDGSRFVESSWQISSLPANYEIVLIEDRNGDGYFDLLFNDSSVFLNDGLVAYGTGAGFKSLVNIGFDKTALEEGKSVFFGDIDGDGKPDRTIWQFNFTTNMSMLPSTVEPEHVVAIAPSIGSDIMVTYEGLPNVYTSPLVCPGYPIKCTPLPVSVVTGHTVGDGIGGVSSFGYAYGGSRIHARGRGFLGFNSTSVTDHQTGVTTTTRYANDISQTVIDTYPDRYPYAGMASYQSATQKSEPVLGPPGNVERPIYKIGNVYDSMSVTEFSLKQTNPGTYFPYVRIKKEDHWETSSQYVSTNTTTTDYDNYGNATSIVISNTDGINVFTKTTTNVYDPVQLRLGRLQRATVLSTTPDGIGTRISAFDYYPDGLLKSQTIEPDQPDSSPLKQTTLYEYDSFGNKTKVTVRALAGYTAASGLQDRITETQYDAFGLFPAKTIKWLGNNSSTHVETYQYEPRHGARTLLIGPNQLATSWEYDDFGRLIRETRADGSETVTRYAWCGATCPNGGTKIISESSGAPRTVVYKDIEDREIRSETDGLRPGSVILQDTTYDRYGRISRKSRPYYLGDSPQDVAFYYDIQDRVTEEHAPDGGKVFYSYAPLTKTITTDIVGGDIAQTTRVETYDVMNRLRSVVENGTVTTTYGYDTFDNQVSVKDNAGNVTTIVSDIRGRKTAMIDPDMGNWAYKYNGFGELVLQTDAKGQQVSMVYDTLGRMTKRTEPEGVTQWFYDSAPRGIGKLAQVEAPDNYKKTLSYDGLGRPQSDVRLISGKNFALDYTYDRFGRVLETVYPTGFATKNVYDTHGYQVEVRNAANDALYWQADDADADGQITLETYGNTLQTARTFDPTSGRVDMITTGTAGNVQFLDFTFDTAGNLQSRARSEGSTNLSETFAYDNLHRLKTASIVGVGNKNFNYDSLGNITQKGTAGDYAYGERGAGPHAVTKAGGQNYDYDANGNMFSGAGRSIGWTSYNKPDLITKGQTTVRFDYGPDRARYRQVKTVGTETTTTVYIDKIYEQVTKGASVEDKHFILAGGKAIAIYTEKTAASATTHYLHHDHLGSVDVVTDATGAVLERSSFSPFGMRRSAINWSDAGGLTSQFTTRGFTGHEQLDEVGLVHMNGRVYDPLLGRFLSADPQVQFPTASQSFNRYSYVHNNPLSYTDPSGFGLFSKIKKAFKKVGSAIKKAFKSQVFRALVAITAAYFTYGALSGTWIWGGEFTAAFAAGFAGGAISSGTLQGGLIGGATAVAFYGVGSGFHQLSKAGWDSGALYFGKVVAHGTVGGLSSQVQGGNFADGFRGAGFTQFASPVVGAVPGGTAERIAAAAAVGGTASKMGGGKFANGAMTGAYSRLFNHEAHMTRRGTRPRVPRSGEVSIDQQIRASKIGFGMLGVFSTPFTGPAGLISGLSLIYDGVTGSPVLGDAAFVAADTVGSANPEAARSAGGIVESFLTGKGAVFGGLRALGRNTRPETVVETFESVRDGALIVNSVGTESEGRQ